MGIIVFILFKLKRWLFVFEVRDFWLELVIDIGVLINNVIIKLAYWFECFIYKRVSLINVLILVFREKFI